MKHLFGLAAAVIVLAVSGFDKHAGHEPACDRLISLAPSITEILYALGLGDRVVGVTQYCEYPAAALDKPKVGALYDLNLEAVLRLRPSLVVLLDDDPRQAGQLSALGIDYQAVSHRNLAGIFGSIEEIGSRCGVRRKAKALAGRLRKGVADVSAKTDSVRRVPVLVVVGRTEVGPASRNVYVSGQDGFYSDILTAAGARNVYEGSTAAAANFSAEALAVLKPEIILEIIPDMQRRGWSRDDVVRSWASLSFIPAVKGKRIAVIDGNHAGVPGPRMLRLLRDVVRSVHPELAEAE